MRLIDRIADWWDCYWPFFALALFLGLGLLCSVGAYHQNSVGSDTGVLWNTLGAITWFWLAWRMIVDGP